MSFDFSKKRSHIASGLIGSTGDLNLEGFADQMEKGERRKDGSEKKKTTYGREYFIALPHELLDVTNIELTERICQKLADEYGVGVHYAVHQPDPLRSGEIRSEESEKNIHAHITITERAMTDGQIHGNKIRALSDKHNDGALGMLKEFTQSEINKELESRGCERIPEKHPDHIPQIKMGHEISAMERKGIRTRVGDINRKILEHNDSLSIPQADAQLGELKEKIDQQKSELIAPQEKKEKGYYVIESYRETYKHIRRCEREFGRAEEIANEFEQRSEEMERRDREEPKVEQYHLRIERRKRELEVSDSEYTASLFDSYEGVSRARGQVFEPSEQFEQEVEDTVQRTSKGIFQSFRDCIQKYRDSCNDWWDRYGIGNSKELELEQDERRVEPDQRQTDPDQQILRHDHNQMGIEDSQIDGRGSREESIETAADEEIIIEEEDVVDVYAIVVYQDPKTDKDMTLSDVVLNHRAMIEDEEYRRSELYLDGVFHQYNPYLHANGSLYEAVEQHPDDPILSRLKGLSEEMDVALEQSALKD